MTILLALMMLVAAVSFPLGLTLPLMRFEKLYFFEETPSLLAIIGELGGEEEWLLALVIGGVSVLLPGVKLVLLFIAAVAGAARRPMALLATVGRWSMMDVMIVALVIFGAKTSGLAAAYSMPGLWFYAAATFASACAAYLLKRRPI